MIRQISFICVLIVGILVSTPFTSAQEIEDPFKSKDNTHTFPPPAHVAAPAENLDMDISTMRRCLDLIGTSLRLGKDQGIRLGLEDRIRMTGSGGDGQGDTASEKKMKRLNLQIEQGLDRFNSAFRSANFPGTERAEFEQFFRVLQLDEATNAQDVERLKLKIQFLEEENKILREQLKQQSPKK